MGLENEAMDKKRTVHQACAAADVKTYTGGVSETVMETLIFVGSAANKMCLKCYFTHCKIAFFLKLVVFN